MGLFSKQSDDLETVTIGTQIWMAKNLNLNVEGSWKTENITNAPEHVYGYGNPANEKEYGRLYTYEAALKACPNGWRLPSKNDFEQLINFLGGANIDTLNALRPNGSSGFKAYPAGRYYNNKYIDGGFECYFWNSSDRWWTFALNYKYQGEIPRFIEIGKASTSALSVRLIKD